MADAPHIFVSGGTEDLRSACAAVQAVIVAEGGHPLTHEQKGHDTAAFCAPMIEMLGKIDFVIHLVGRNYGGEPETRLPGEPRRSFSQLEYDFCTLHKRKICVVICGDRFPYDLTMPEEMEKQRLQEVHRKFLQSGNRKYQVVGSLGDLERCVRRLVHNPDSVEKIAPVTKRSISPWWFGTAAAIVFGASVLMARRWFHHHGSWPAVRTELTAPMADAPPSRDPKAPDDIGGEKEPVPAPAPVPPSPAAPSPAKIAPSVPAAPADPPSAPVADNTMITEEIRRDVLKRIAAAPGISPEKKDKLSHAIERAQEMRRVVVLPFDTGIGHLSADNETRALGLFEDPEMLDFRDDITVIFVVLGFADVRGGVMRNRALSEARAKSVQELMAGPGKFANIVHPFGMGETEMLDANNLAKNRIAEIWAVRPQ
ncbi:MAG: hypothetical protein ABI680_10540 [Chthoniobacteraceae bacterium]